jgi:hypothetical protein
MSKSTNNNTTMKFTDVDPVKLIVDMATMPNGDVVPLIKYEHKSQNIVFQAPRCKMVSYGLAPGEYLSNGEKNEWYRSDEARDTMKIPIDPDMCAVVVKDDGTTNAQEIAKFRDFLKAIDNFIENSEAIHTAVGIDKSHVKKYVPILRLPAKPVKKAGDKKDKLVKVKPAYIKTKLLVNNKNKKEITTEFYNVDTSNKTTRVVTSGNYITLEDLEKFYEHNCDQQPVIQLVKVWYKSNGEWGITLRLVMSRIRKPEKTIKSASIGFIDDDDEVSTEQKTNNQVPSDDSDDEIVQKPKHSIKDTADSKADESDDEQVSKKPTKPVVQKPQDSDSEEVVPVKKLPKQPVKKDVESSDSDVVPVKKPVRQPVKKEVESDDSDEEVVAVRKPPVRKPKK